MRVGIVNGLIDIGGNLVGKYFGELSCLRSRFSFIVSLKLVVVELLNDMFCLWTLEFYEKGKLLNHILESEA